jgi:hypothetical protein
MAPYAVESPSEVREKDRSRAFGPGLPHLHEYQASPVGSRVVGLPCDLCAVLEDCRARYVRQAGCATPHGRGIRSGTGWRSKTLSGLFGPAFTGRLSWGFQRSPLHRHGQLASTPAWVPGWGLATSGLSLRPDPARGRVLFRLHGFSPSWWFAPRAVLRVCCTPLPILGFVEFRAGHTVPFGSGGSCRSHRRLHPSKLFPCPQPSLFRGLMPSCRSPSGNPVGPTSRPCSTGQVRRGRRCCHRLSLVASLGFASTWQGGSFGSSEDLRHSLEQSRRGSSSCPTPPCLGTPCGVSWLGLRAFEGLSARAGRWVRLPLLVAEATKGVRSGRFIRASFPLRSGCEHPLRIGTGRGPKPSPVAGDHDASGTRPR